MYNTLLLKKKAYPTSETKWNKEIEVTRHDWSKIYSLPFKCTKEEKLKPKVQIEDGFIYSMN